MGPAQYSGAMRGATMAESPPARPGYGSWASVWVGGGRCRGNYFDKVFTYGNMGLALGVSLRK